MRPRSRRLLALLVLVALSAMSSARAENCDRNASASCRPSTTKFAPSTPLEGWDVMVTYHYAEVQIGGGILWKQAQHHEATLSSDYFASRTLAQNYAKNGLWLDPSSGGSPTPPQHYLPAGAIHDVALIYVYINVK